MDETPKPPQPTHTQNIGDQAHVDIAVAGDVAGGIHHHRYEAPPAAQPIQIDQDISGDVLGEVIINTGTYSKTVHHASLPPIPLPPLDEAHALLASLPQESIPEPGTLPTPHRMPYVRNDLFVGRDAELRTLAADLVAQRTIVVTTGMGGVGKTQLAIELAYRYGRYFAGGVFWVSCADPSTIPSEIAACGGAGGMRLYHDQSGISFDDQVKMVRAEWVKEYPRLLIFDNCEEEALLAQYRPRGGGCRVLVTSRRQQWAASLRVITHPLETLLRAESVQLLQALAPKLGAKEADMLAAALGDLPLALHLAGSFLAQYGAVVSVAQYLAELAKPTLLEHWSLHGERGGKPWVGPAPTGRELHVAKAFALSLDRLDRADTTDALALKALARAALLASGEPFPAALLRRMLLQEDDNEAAVEAQEALRRLADLGLLEGEPQEALRVHRLISAFVQQVVHDDAALGDVEQVLSAEASRVNRAGYPSGMQPIVAHLTHAAQRAQTRADEQAAMLLNNLGYHLNAQGAYGKVEPLLERALAIREAVLGVEHPDTATSLNNLAGLYRAQGAYGKAEPLLERALAIQEAVLGAEHPDTATSLNNLAELHHTQGAYGAAESLIKRALAIQEAVQGGDHPEMARSLNNLAELYRAQGAYEQAKPLMKRALAIQEVVLGVEHPDTARSLNNLAGLYKMQGLYEQAEPLMKRALAIREAVLGVEHPDTARSLNNLAELYWIQGLYEQAEMLYERALAIWKAVLGAEHPDTARSLNNLAELYRAQGLYEQAEPLMKQALVIQEVVLGAEHPETATLLNNLAGLYWSQGLYEQAEPLMKRALVIKEGVLGAEHPDTATLLNNLAMLKQAQGAYGKAEVLMRRALGILEVVLGTEHPDTARSLNNLGICFAHQERYEGAADFLRRALLIYEQTMGLQHPHTIGMRQSLAVVEERLRKAEG